MTKDEVSIIVDELIKDNSSKNMMKNAIKNFFFDIEQIKSSVIVYFFSIPLAIYISLSPNTISYMQNISTTLLTVLLTVFTGLFTVYAIVISIINKTTILKMIEAKTSNTSFLIHILSFYESTLMIYFIGIFISLIVTMTVNITDENFILTSNYNFNCLMAFILILIYLNSMLRIIYEIKSIIFSTVTLAKFTIVFTIEDIILNDKI